MESREELNAWIGVEPVLVKLKQSCLALHKRYKDEYTLAKSRQKFYDVPIIVLSGVNSILIAGAQSYLDATYVTLATCFLSLVVSIIQSLKTFFRVDERRDNMLSTNKDLFRLYVVMSVTLDQPSSLRGIEPKRFLMDNYSEYQKILDKASVINVGDDPIYEDIRNLVSNNINTQPNST